MVGHTASRLWVDAVGVHQCPRLLILNPQVPSDSVFVTRFMGGYTENVPPDEFDALPVRKGRLVLLWLGLGALNGGRVQGLCRRNEFGALPVRGVATLGCGCGGSSHAAVCWDGRDVWRPDVRFSSSDSYAVLHCLQGRAKQRGAALPGVREAAN